jgi:EAL domain-containing protein (putative c-di-GMP-specific phosphodiesterase class I)
VQDILTNPSNAVIARTVVALGHSLGLTVIAEGVETAAQCALLSELGCDGFQGLHFGSPAPASELARFIDKKHI